MAKELDPSLRRCGGGDSDEMLSIVRERIKGLADDLKELDVLGDWYLCAPLRSKWARQVVRCLPRDRGRLTS